MTKDTKGKPMGWLKGVLSNQNQIEQGNSEEEASTEIVEEQVSRVENSNPSAPPSNKYLFSKDNQDKLSLDVIVSLENMLNDRQIILYKNKDLESQLFTANEMISRLKYDLAKKEQLVQDKNQEISSLENDLTHKQMSYDQLLEDYKDYQYTSNTNFEKISNQLEKEINKYGKLNEEYTNSQYQSMLKVNKLEEKIRELEIENQKHKEQCQKILNEKNELLQTINDFTERMSFSFSPKSTASSTQS